MVETLDEYGGKDLPATPGDENDPAYEEEMFETHKFMKTDPAMLVDPAYRAKYVAWLELHKDDPE